MKMNLLLMLLAIALMASNAQANLLKNPSFEEGAFGEKNVYTPDYWTHWWTSLSPTHTWISDADEAHCGSKYMKMKMWYDSSTAWLFQTVDVMPNTEYVFSVWAKCPVEGEQAEAWGYYEWLNAAGTIIGQDWLSYWDWVEDDWEYAEFAKIVSPELATQVIFSLVCGTENGFRGILFDDAYVDIPRPFKPSPTDGATILFGDVDLSWTNIDPNHPPISSVWVEVLFGTEPNETDDDYDMVPLPLDPASGQDVTSVTINVPDLGTYYWQVNSYIYGDPAEVDYDTGDPDDPNVRKGELWSFTATDDLPPSVTVHTPAMIAWQNEPVQLDATVVDEGKTPVNLEWTSSITGVTFTPNEFAEDPEVSIVMGNYTNANIKNPSFELGLAYWTGAGGTWDGIWGDRYIRASDGLLLAYTWDTGTEDNGLSQTLTETFTADTTYTLTVDVANDGYWEEDVQYRVQLRAGGSILAEDYDEHDLPVPGGLGVWKTSTVVYTCGGESDPNFVYVGEPLEIRLMAINDTWEMSFDNVHLTADPGFPAQPGSTYELTLTATDAVGSDSDTVTIDVYDNACQAAQLGLSLLADNPTDIDANCDTAVGDLAELAASWLNSTKLTAAEEDLRPALPALNSGFQLYKPGTDFTVTAEMAPAGSVDSAGFIVLGDGGVRTVQNNGYAIYPDGTIGDTVICPGWIDDDPGSEVYSGPHAGGTNACYHGLGSWDGANNTTIITAESLGVIEANRIYTISAKITGLVGNGPLVFDLLADGVPLTPTTIVKPPSPGAPDYVIFTKTYDPNAVESNIGESMKIRFGVPPENDKGAHFFADDITLDIVPINPNAPSVNAGVDMVTWSGQPVVPNASAVNNGVGDLTYAWTADPDDGVVITGDTTLAPTVTITKATANPSPVKLTLAVTLEGVDTVSDTMMIDVYDDACKASRGNGHEYAATDFDGDCVTSLSDFAVMAQSWLDDYELTGPVEKP